MPTAAKLVAAVVFAIVGWIAANAHVPALGEAVNVGAFRELVGLLGMLIGWRVMGPAVGHGYQAALGSGIKTAVVLAFLALLIFSTREMVLTSMKMRYDGPVDAVLAIFQLMLEHAQKMLTFNVIIVLVVGGLVGGVISERASKRWS
ncbi:TrgA family protein [Tabrizicola sp.]|uniref:TrgA family protein n=1 Tax=Tabrizicola sp. TaxID=2005166 RepID=UPI00286AC2D1|nr:TrgA family protein [Tabrizicola sp.]